MSAVSFDDRKAHAMLREQSIETLPEFDILDRHPTSAIFALPTVLLPIRKPTGASVCDIFAVSNDLHDRRTCERFQTADDSHQFHLIVGCVCRSARKFLLGVGLRMSQNAGPTTW